MAYEEYMGYRANSKCPETWKNGQISIFAERRKEESAFWGIYGGDAFPKVFESESNNLSYGITIAADGVSQAFYTHESLKENLSKICEEYPSEYKEKNEAKLYAFLSKLYGEDFLKDEVSLDYACQCFSNIPADGFFSCEKNNWKNAETNRQVECAFFERDSQSLGSRIVCVGVFYKFKDWAKNKNLSEWNENSAKDIKHEIDSYINGDLRKNVLELFAHSDAPSTDRRNTYFLCSTLAVWLYISNSETNKVSALALNCGDARCYAIDLKDGVRQYSIDDANPDGEMTAFVHFGQKSEEKKCSLHAGFVKFDYPCALFTCSDGIYDTCNDEKSNVVKYKNSAGANDFLFEANLLKTLRECYSFEDFRKQIVFNFYAQAKYNLGEMTEFGTLLGIKKDDSGTLAGKFFGGNDGLKLFEALRENKTTLDEIIEKVNSESMPYVKPRAKNNEDIINTFVNGKFKDIGTELKKYYSDAFDEMQNDGFSTLWGIETNGKKLNGFSLNQFFLKNINKRSILLNTLEYYKKYILEDDISDKKGLRVLEQEKKYVCVLSIEDIVKFLKQIGFESFVEELNDVGQNEQMEKYKEFLTMFYTDLPENSYIIDFEKYQRVSKLGNKNEL